MNYQNEIVVMDAKPSPKAQKHIEKCMAENVCLCGCGVKQLKRGLAPRCYYAYRTARAKLPTKALKAAFDAKLIRIGRLLWEQACRAYRRKSVFDKVSEEVG